MIPTLLSALHTVVLRYSERAKKKNSLASDPVLLSRDYTMGKMYPPRPPVGRLGAGETKVLLRQRPGATRGRGAAPAGRSATTNLQAMDSPSTLLRTVRPCGHLYPAQFQGCSRGAAASCVHEPLKRLWARARRVHAEVPDELV